MYIHLTYLAGIIKESDRKAAISKAWITAQWMNLLIILTIQGIKIDTISYLVDKRIFSPLLIIYC